MMTIGAEDRPPSGSEMNEPQLSAAWYLEGFADDGLEIWRTTVGHLPFRIGRRIDCDLVLAARRVSLHHACLYLRQDALWLRDLGSTNGTFLNGERLTADQPLADGDVIHFADQEFRLIATPRIHLPLATETTAFPAVDLDSLHSHVFEQQRRLREMLEGGEVRTSFQPMVRLADGAVVAYEVLGRGDGASSEILAAELFSVAEAIGLASELSSAFRAKGLEEAARLPGDPEVFVNTHPAELRQRRDLVASLERLRSRHPSRRLVLEIHEAAAADPATLRALRADLENLRIGLAFDDFGTGQTRLLELIDVSPQYVKFDRSWIKDLHRASRKRREMVETLVALVSEWDVAPIAEGVENADEEATCIDLGFAYAQGFRYGRPAPAADFAAG